LYEQSSKRENGKVWTNGGRVVGVTALGNSLEQAISVAYSAANKINWPNKYCRTDIGKKGLSHL
jgi:phosphoribosylamine--glycine ligase